MAASWLLATASTADTAAVAPGERYTVLHPRRNDTAMFGMVAALVVA